MYEVHYSQLLKKREEFRKLHSVSLRNYKLEHMILSANACGIDLAAFVMEKQIEKSTKASLLLQKQEAKAEQKLPCPYCEAVFCNSKQLAGHLKRHSSKYQVFNVKAQKNEIHEDTTVANGR